MLLAMLMLNRVQHDCEDGMLTLKQVQGDVVSHDGSGGRRAGDLSAAPHSAISLRTCREAFVLEDFADLFFVEPLRLNFFNFGIARADFATGHA